MSQRQFYKEFFITIAVAGLLTLGMLQWEPLKVFLDFAVICFIFFTGLTIGVYVLGDYLVKQSNKMLFTYFSMFVILFKLVAAILIVVGYDRLIVPPNKNYIIIFGVMYIVYSVFEVKILMQLSKVKPE
jgi:hypothetical protein